MEVPIKCYPETLPGEFLVSQIDQLPEVDRDNINWDGVAQVIGRQVLYEIGLRQIQQIDTV